MNTTLSRIQRELKDPKKASLVVLLIAVSMLLWGRLLLKHVPQMASADPAAAVSTPVDSGGMGELSGPVLPERADKPIVAVDLAQDVSRDLFLLPHDKYEPVEDETNAQEPGKSPAEPADDRGWRRAVREAASELSLQSVVTGDQPRAIINGQLVAPGQAVDGFTVTRVAERFVELEKDGMTVRLKL